ncbi:MAG: bacillithiol biosynthesis cysteine-adding enzyme BshC [Gemmatimonadetes bacterium]|nr:bacillithiol biosynthesis cysteine-adding enzyme BshC [Gemmatimonadota bacterium]MDA1104360.1 bacillithiol biosynthesis cysteine-adding enzyme BshC [Gemmatimonadota bacterium]
MDLIVSHPTGSEVVRDYLAGERSVESFFGSHFRDASAYVAKATEVDSRFDGSARERAVEAIIVPEGGDQGRLERFVEEGGYMVTTGQQPALFGGPLYSIYKAMTAIRLAEALESRLGKTVLPLFWVASDDHDWAEANHTDMVGIDNELHRFEVQAPTPEKAPSLHRIPLGSDAAQVADRFLEHVPSTEFSDAYIELIRGFAPGATLPAGFHQMLQRILGPYGLFFTDAAHPALKQHSAEWLLRELSGSADHEAVLQGTADQLEAAGYHLQVPIMEGGVNLFMEGPSGRERLYREGDSFRLRTSGQVLTEAQIRSACQEDPSVLSPNVLFRPVVESVVFPTLAYVGGPGEMAYFAQLKSYFEAHGVGMPVVYPRWAATPVETKIRKVLDKFGVAPESLRRPFHEIASEIAREEVPGDIRAALGKLRGAIGGGVGELQKAAAALDPTLKGPVQHLRSQSLAALDNVEKKILQAVKRESEIMLSQLEKAQLHLYPAGKPAERVQNPTYFLARYGGAFLDAVYERFEVNLD